MNLEEMIKTLQQEYLAGLPEKISQIEKIIQSKETAAMRDCFHKLKGTGSTYGLPEVSELGQAVEEVCIQRPASAAEAATLGVVLLREIYQSRQRQVPFNVSADSRFATLHKLLQKA